MKVTVSYFLYPYRQSCLTAVHHLNIEFFWTTRESALLYGAETCTLMTKLRGRLDGTYKMMLRALLGVSKKKIAKVA